MRDLPGFYWDEERQRYFALQPEHVARGLQRCAFITPALVRASSSPILSPSELSSFDHL
jgi:hypothetical protein